MPPSLTLTRYLYATVASVPKDKVESYRSTLAESAALWKEFGALSYVEGLADDVPYGGFETIIEA